jgi:hypothetical protein
MSAQQQHQQHARSAEDRCLPMQQAARCFASVVHVGVLQLLLLLQQQQLLHSCAVVQ